MRPTALMATRIGTLAQRLARGNPWWRDAAWAAKDPDLQDAAAVDIAYQRDAWRCASQDA